MPTINELSTLDVISSSDKIPVYSNTNGYARKASFATVASFLSGSITATDQFVTQYAAPSTTGFTVNILNANNSVWLVLTPTGTLAAGTILLPSVANCVDRQEILVNTTNAVTALTVGGNGATVTGAPTTLAANAFFRLKFDAVMDVWYRVG